MTSKPAVPSNLQQPQITSLSRPPHDSPYADGPVSSSPASRDPSHKTARRPSPPPAVSPRGTHKPRVAHESAKVPAARTRPSRRRRGGGSGPAISELTSHPTSRNAYVATRVWLLEQHGPVCAYCGTRFSARVMTLDHVAPRKGQTAYDRRDNLVLACPGCNMAKRDLAPLAFLLASRSRAVNLVRYGEHLSPMLLDLARSLVPADSQSSPAPVERVQWSLMGDTDGDSPYRD
ncbi:MAG: HNH endonuclease signature motif containing protein [bacterium]